MSARSRSGVVFREEIEVIGRWIGNRYVPYEIPRRSEVIILVERDYPEECFGAPKYYVAYIRDERGRERLLGSGRNWRELRDSILRWKTNERFSNFYREELDELLTYIERKLEE